MAATPNCQAVESAVLAEFPDARFGRFNCRHISSNPVKSWSQHAGSEPGKRFYGNALDITHQAWGYSSHPTHQTWLRQVRAFLDARAVVLQIDQLLSPGDKAHADHVHISTFPKMKSNWWYRPPCKGGRLVVINQDGSTDSTFGDVVPPPPPPNMEDDMALRRNDTGNAVGKLQRGLLAWNPNALPQWGVDEDYGAETEHWVGEFQKAAELDDTQDGVTLGVADSTTIAYILSNLTSEGVPGPQGPQGDPGPQGPEGNQGPAGEGLTPGDTITSTVQ
jgi:hypothetical protein